MATAAMASVSMGVMKSVLAKLTNLMGDEYKMIKGLRKDVTFLRHELSEMYALLESMDNADELDPLAKKWRKDIIEMSYTIEDYIDDFIHHFGEKADDDMGILRKASEYLRTFWDRRRIANQFQEIKSRVMEASERRKRYGFDQCISITAPVVVDPRISVLYKESASLVGIDAEKEKLVNWAMDEGKQLKFLPIVGFGGVGKTTLANEVYREIGDKFECKAFVSVSQKPEMIGLFNSLLSQLGKQPNSHPCPLQDLINDIRGHLQDKRYFIVVDDLWEMEAWDAIQYAFPQNNQRSRVMITTRHEKVAERCCSTSGIVHNMKPLSEPNSKKLFFTRIFGSQDNCPSEFEEVSCAILKRCGGLPLAIITVAGILASQQTKLKEAWEYIQSALAPEQESNIDYENMMYILDLSYKHLPLHLKACFLYLGTYPEDYKIDRVELVRRWVAEGFVSNSVGLNVWDVAERYFNELVNRSIIQPDWSNGDKELISHCRVHDMMLDLILRKCKEDNFLILVNDPHEVEAARQDKVIRRLTVDFKHVEDGRMANKTIVGNLSHLRSLTILRLGRRSMWMPPLLELKFVRVLFLHTNCWYENETDLFFIINQLSHLRYVKAVGGGGGSDNIVVPIHHQIKGLRFLETLDLYDLWVPAQLRKVPLDLVDLPRLFHLSAPRDSCIGLPRGIGEMKQLCTLCGFHLEYSSSESIVGLGELTALSELSLISPALHRGVPIILQWKPTWMAAMSTSLEKLDKLRSLQVKPFYFDHVACCADPLSLLSPHWGASLEWLFLSDWSFSIVPRWISHLRSLKRLSLGVKQIIQDDIGLIGMLPSLIGLHLRIVHVPTTRIVIGGGFFTFVEWFCFDCDEISSLAFEAGAMPNLAHLKLAFNILDWPDRATPKGLQHLEGLQQISVQEARCDSDCRPYESYEADVALIRSLFQDTVDVLPTRPVFTFHDGFLMRPEELDQCEEDRCI